MREFVKLAARLSIIFEWCTKLLKQFVTLTRWFAIALLSVGFLFEVVKALLTCILTRRHVETHGGVWFL
jgi:hypothetical protein